MSNVKNAKAVSLNHISSKFGEGVSINPIRTANDPYGTNPGCGTTCMPVTCRTCLGGCGSSNKIKIYQ